MGLKIMNRLSRKRLDRTHKDNAFKRVETNRYDQGLLFLLKISWLKQAVNAETSSHINKNDEDDNLLLKYSRGI